MVEPRAPCYPSRDTGRTTPIPPDRCARQPPPPTQPSLPISARPPPFGDHLLLPRSVVGVAPRTRRIDICRSPAYSPWMRSCTYLYIYYIYIYRTRSIICTNVYAFHRFTCNTGETHIIHGYNNDIVSLYHIRLTHFHVFISSSAMRRRGGCTPASSLAQRLALRVYTIQRVEEDLNRARIAVSAISIYIYTMYTGCSISVGSKNYHSY